VKTWNVCLTHDPIYGGMYRAVEDFSAALNGPVLSFDDGRRIGDEGVGSSRRVRLSAGSGLLGRRCLWISSAAAMAADSTVAEAQLLVTHSMFRAHADWARRWAATHRRLYWAVPHGCLDPWGLSQSQAAKRLWLEAVGRRYLDDAEWVIFATRREMEKAEPWTRSARAVVVPWPVRFPSLEHRQDARTAVRRELGISEAAKVLLFVGRLHSMKRPLETVAAFASTSAANTHLVVVGMDGDLSRSDVEASVPRRLADRVHVIGPQVGHRLEAIWLAGDGFISLSQRENFSYSMAEAMSYGLPLIVSRGHDLAHELQGTGNGGISCGWLVENAGVDSAVEAIVAFDSMSEQETAALGAVGREWAGRKLSPAAFRRRLNSLADGGRQSDGD
jgi:glycosyltransferase involved in cell wall biosynthesis